MNLVVVSFDDSPGDPGKSVKGSPHGQGGHGVSELGEEVCPGQEAASKDLPLAEVLVLGAPVLKEDRAQAVTSKVERGVLGHAGVVHQFEGGPDVRVNSQGLRGVKHETGGPGPQGKAISGRGLGVHGVFDEKSAQFYLFTESVSSAN